MKTLLTFGTRPEAIKMAPVYHALRERCGSQAKICVSGQHRQMLDSVMDLFSMTPDFDLDIMQPGQDLTDVTCRTLVGLRDVFRGWRPDHVLVHGDTTTSLAAALAAFYAGIPVGHVEAGLRTYNLASPWPEEMNRQATSRIAKWHFAPTAAAKANLLGEGVPDTAIFVTGNTVIDALISMSARLEEEPDAEGNLLRELGLSFACKRLVLVTGHRRENFGHGLEQICVALKRIAEYPDVEIVYPVHLNPNVREPVTRLLGGLSNVHLFEPLDYRSFVLLMKRSTLILTDSGGIQEEAPSLGKPVLVMRDTTERPEAIAAGTALLVGTDADSIYRVTIELLEDEQRYALMSNAVNPFGDGQASRRIVEALERGGPPDRHAS